MKRKLLSILLSLTIILSIPQGVFSTSALYDLKTHNQDPDLDLIISTYKYIKETYPFEISDKDISESALKAMLRTLDPYSDYYTKEERQEVYSSIQGSFTGIGVYIQKTGDYIKITNPIEGSQAEKAGLLAEDLIIKVNGQDIKDISLDEASRLIKGPTGTKVKLEIQRKNKRLNFEITRQEVIINPVKYEVLPGKIGYIKLTEFTQNSSQEVKKALYYLQTEKITKIILDLRNNPGGLVDEAIEVASLFVDRGPVVHVKEKNKPPLSHYATIIYPNKELVVLVNENSASASEIVTGAIKDRKAGTIIGKKTFGKGIIQNILPLQNGSLIKMTTSEYLTPNYTSIHKTGIQPHIELDNTEGKDLQLERAVQVLKDN